MCLLVIKALIIFESDNYFPIRLSFLIGGIECIECPRSKLTYFLGQAKVSNSLEKQQLDILLNNNLIFTLTFSSVFGV